jgi:FkbM family methyltransferase
VSFRRAVLRTAERGGFEPALRFAHAALQGKEQRRNWRDDLQLRRLLRGLPADASCVDVGANVGTILKAIVAAAPEGRHVAIEPLPDLADALRRAFPDVDVRSVAVSDRPGRRPFVRVVDRPSRSGLHPGGYVSEDFARVEPMTVEVETLDRVLASAAEPALIKIDVEGTELEVLRGAAGTLTSCRPLVVFEHAAVGSSDALHDELCSRHGYAIFDMDGDGPLSRERFAELVDANVRWNFVAKP